MFVLFFALWVIFNGAFTLEIAVFGLVISAGIYAFTCIFMNFSIRKDLALCARIFLFLYYLLVLLREIVKANIVMARYIVVKQEYELHPVIFKYQTKLKSRICRVLLANSITLTPGTITVSLNEDMLVIHAVDEPLAIEDDGNFIFEELLFKIENFGKRPLTDEDTETEKSVEKGAFK